MDRKKAHHGRRSPRWISVNGAIIILAIAGALLWKNQNGADVSTRLVEPEPLHATLTSQSEVNGREKSMAATLAGKAAIPLSAEGTWDAHWHHSADFSSRETTSLSTDQWLALHPTDRVAVVTKALSEAAAISSADAVREAIRFCAEDPSYSLEYGRELISTLSERGEFDAALRFVVAEESEGGLGENGQKWLTTLFTSWATSNPAEAAAATQRAVGPGLRGEALQAVAAVWVKSDPVALTNFVKQLPPSSEQAMIWESTLRRWTESDPVAAATWLAHRSDNGAVRPISTQR